MRFKGTITEWNDGRGFGFINPAEGGPRVFCHISAFQGRPSRPAAGQVVTYELARDERGRPRAQQIRPSGQAASSRHQAATPPQLGRAITLSGLFLAAVLALAVSGSLSWKVPAWYFGASVVLFLFYGWDKTAAEGGHWRTREQTLQLLALIGGWPGGWVGQQAFRHKSRKVSFQVAFWLAVLLNVAALAWLVYAGGDLAILDDQGGYGASGGSGWMLACGRQLEA